jgi:hypothetical protein
MNADRISYKSDLDRTAVTCGCGPSIVFASCHTLRWQWKVSAAVHDFGESTLGGMCVSKLRSHEWLIDSVKGVRVHVSN